MSVKKKKQYGLLYVRPGYKIGKKQYKPQSKDTLTPEQRDIAKDFRQELINNATEAEKTLLVLVKSIKGMSFQKVVCRNKKFYFPDFTFDLKHGKKLYVEIDGGYHLTTEQQDKDFQRTKMLCRKGDRLIRFTNDEVAVNPEAVVVQILKQINAPSNS